MTWQWVLLYEAPFAEMPLILGRSGTQSVAMVTKLFHSNCGTHLGESYCKESNISDSNWLRYLFSSYYFDQNLVECMTSSLGNLFMSMSTCLCSEIALIEKMQFSSQWHFKHDKASFVLQHKMVKKANPCWAEIHIITFNLEKGNNRMTVKHRVCSIPNFYLKGK